MPLLASNFTSNSLSGTVKVSGGAANISFAVAPFAFEGTKQFVVKLRRGSTFGDVLATSDTITINDFSEIVSLTANVSTVNEGNIVSISLVTANVPNNATVFYSVFPVTANVTASDFYGANSGAIAIINNQATFSFYANTDAGFVNEDGETFKVQLRTQSTSGNIVYTTSNILVTDFYKLYNIFSITESAAILNEGGYSNITIIGHNVPTGVTLYYDTVGNVNSGNFVTGNTGSFVMNSEANAISLLTTNSIPTYETRAFSVNIRKDSITGTILATSNVITIKDSAYAYSSGTGGIEFYTADGYKNHIFTASGNLTISSIGATYNTFDYLIVAGGGGGGAGSSTNVLGGGGGGAGGLLQANATAVFNAAGTYSVVVGAAGAGGTSNATGVNGGNSYISGTSLPIAVGGGGGGGLQSTNQARPGGSGGGAVYASPAPVSIGTGVAGQGNPGGMFAPNARNSGGGGGAGSRGYTFPDSSGGNTNGGIGLAANFSLPTAYGTPGPSPVGRYFAGGGGGGLTTEPGYPWTAATGGAGGGGAGGIAPGVGVGVSGTGGGGGGAYGAGTGGAGGSGIVIVRYRANPDSVSMEATGGNVSILNGYKTHVFTNANTFTINTLTANPTRNSFEYMVVAGGGGAGSSFGGFYGQGGGGAGGFVRGNVSVAAANIYSVVIGAGGGGGGPAAPPFYSSYAGASGSASTLSNTAANVTVTAVGGGYWNTPGGSGGGNSASGTPGQGYPGGAGPGDGAGGGAGGAGVLKAGGIGRNFDTPTYFGDPGPAPGRYFAGGGAGFYGTAGLGGGGRAPAPAPANGAGFAGNVNTGGGGGGTGAADTFQGGIGGSGGSGIVVIRYPYN